MARIRIRPNGRIQFDLHIFGLRFREGTKMMNTPSNLKKAKATLKKMNAEIALGTFQYRDYFPNSTKKVALFETRQRELYPDILYPFFDDYANEWFERQKSNWKVGYQQNVRSILDTHLIPYFGNILINEITLAHLDHFRQQRKNHTKADGTPALSKKRINHIIWPLVAIVSLASEEHKFDYPFRRYKAFKEQPADSAPLSINEVQQFLAHVPHEWYDYFLIRFWTGMRSCEIHGLEWQHIDFEHRLIKVRQNYVGGEIGEVKTPKSRRDLPMCDTLYYAFMRLKKNAVSATSLVFTHPNGDGLTTHYIAKYLWYPTLENAGLKRRRAYETRHTTAVLHIAAQENPAYISHILGHSNMQLLFAVYAPYVANASRHDGLAFNQLMQEVIL